MFVAASRALVSRVYVCIEFFFAIRPQDGSIGIGIRVQALADQWKRAIRNCRSQQRGTGGTIIHNSSDYTNIVSNNDSLATRETDNLGTKEPISYEGISAFDRLIVETKRRRQARRNSTRVMEIE